MLMRLWMKYYQSGIKEDYNNILTLLTSSWLIILKVHHWEIIKTQCMLIFYIF